jgi:hypothetical protein
VRGSLQQAAARQESSGPELVPGCDTNTAPLIFKGAVFHVRARFVLLAAVRAHSRHPRTLQTSMVFSLTFLVLSVSRLLYSLAQHPMVERRTQGRLVSVVRFILRPVHFVVVWNPFTPWLPPQFSSRTFSLIQDFDRHPVLSARLLQRMDPETLARSVLYYRGEPASTKAASTLLSLVTDRDARLHIIRYIVLDPQLLHHVMLTELTPIQNDPARSSELAPWMNAIAESPALSLSALIDLDAKLALELLNTVRNRGLPNPLVARWPAASGTALDVLNALSSQAPGSHPFSYLITQAEMCIDTTQPGWDGLLQASLRRDRYFVTVHLMCAPLRNRPELITEIAQLITAGAPVDFAALVEVADALNAS